MNYIIKGYSPEKLFNYFEDISAIPRGSGNEKGIADFLVSFAEKRGLFCIRDELNNVFIRKNATSGYEDIPAIMLQGHTDMVCEQNEGTGHDFENEGLDLYIENGWLKAKGTTLGGDDGVAVAIMMAILDDNTLEHPMIECLFTTGEETGLYGATGFDYSVVKAQKLINLDSEEEGIGTVSCAGGLELDFTLNAERYPIPSFARPISVEINGLCGGHSGADIIFERGNANVILFKMLSGLYEKHPFNIITFNGGSRGNAIPREAKAVIFTDEPAEATEYLISLIPSVKELLPKEDRKLRIKVGKAKGNFETMYSFADTVKLLSLPSFIPNGVIARMKDIPDMVESSNNLGVVKELDGCIKFIYHPRSSFDSRMDEIEIIARQVAKTLSFELEISGRYSGWPMKADSQLGKQFMRVSKQVLGENCKPKLCAIHAGLECGIICSAVPGMDAISIGPALKGIHAPGEALELSSMERLYKIVCELIKQK